MSQRDWGFYITAILIFPERIAEMRSGIRNLRQQKMFRGSENSARFIRRMSNFGIGDLGCESQRMHANSRLTLYRLIFHTKY